MVPTLTCGLSLVKTSLTIADSEIAPLCDMPGSATSNAPASPPGDVRQKGHDGEMECSEPRLRLRLAADPCDPPAGQLQSRAQPPQERRPADDGGQAAGR